MDYRKKLVTMGKFGKQRPTWMWLKIKKQGQTAGFGPCFHLPVLVHVKPVLVHVLAFRFFEPQPLKTWLDTSRLPNGRPGAFGESSFQKRGAFAALIKSPER